MTGAVTGEYLTVIWIRILTACLPWRFKGEGIQLPVESHLRLWAIICVSSPGTLFITCVSMVWEMSGNGEMPLAASAGARLTISPILGKV